LVGCRADAQPGGGNPEVEAYLASYAKQYQRLSYASAEAEWASNTRIVEGDSSNAVRTRQANEALARFVGSAENIGKIQQFLSRKDQLTPLQVRELEVMLYLAAEKPQTAADVVSRRIAAEAAQTETLYGYQFRLKNKPGPLTTSIRRCVPARDFLTGWRSGKRPRPWGLL
jgi:peptidyl-dipeptidase A